MYVMRKRPWGKGLAALSAVIFAVFSFNNMALAQVEVSPAGTSGVDVVKGDIKQPLPKPGNVTVNFKDVDIKTVLHYLSEVSNVDIIPSPGVEGKVTMRLRDKPWETALDIVTRNYGFTYSREGDIIRVIPKGQLQTEEPVTEVISLSNFIQEIELEKEPGDEEVTVRRKEESINQLMTAVNSIIDRGRGERATYIASVNSIVVTAIPARISEIKSMIAEIDMKTPQIVLDARVVEIQLDEDERFGVDWRAIISAAGSRRPITFPFNPTGVIPFLPGEMQRQWYPQTDGAIDTGRTDFPFFTIPAISPNTAPTANSFFSFGTLDFSTFTATLSLLEDRDDTEILSSPRITTLDNQRATIKVIQKIMLQEAVQSTDTANLVTVQYESVDNAREVGVKLTVIPHVNDEGDISVNLLPEVSDNEGFDVFTIPGGAAVTQTAYLTFSSREANTIIRVQDGETIFLGGLIRKRIDQTDNKFPVLGDLLGGIPVLGNAFKYEAELVRRSEIVFFVTVYLVKDGWDAVDKSSTVPEYEKFFSKREKANNPTRPPVVKVGSFDKVSKETVEVPSTGPPAGKNKKYEPFLDFRKKGE